MADRCEHKPIIGCALTALPGCCACADKRPMATAYPVYIDGQGMRLQGKCWQRYCWKCRDYWNLQSQSTQSPSLSMDSRHRDVDISGGSNQSEASNERNVNRLYNLPNAPLPALTSWSFEGVPGSQQPRSHDPSHSSTPQSTNAGSSPFTGPSATNVQRDLAIRTNESRNRPHPQENQPSSDITNPPPETTGRRRRAIVNPFGTREEIESESYSSPVADLFGRAWNRYREAQEALQSARVRAEDERRIAGDVNILSTRPPSSDTPDFEMAMALHRSREDWDEHGVFMTFENPFRQRQRENPHAHPGVNPIDQQTSRPPPLESEDMTVSLACKICCEQKVDTLLEPCMHVAICHWCSELVRDRARRRRQRHYGPTEDEDKWKCPICRRDVTQSRRVYLP
ncbi:hypothetical protein HRR86_007865 [Exophiala dermatitidis]|nr:hypothetical protein HRR73_005486 [Exophiala dermatitidis]KAJ4604764.1 hypothetical protein HRR84_001847 [Exophiala dermatitidis]KAJ4615861.1 hypothetical protein HRR86_007865 [Exophiala dermatitidis]